MNSVDNTKWTCIHPYFVSETKKEVRNVFNECREINRPTWNPSEGHSAMDMEVLYISSLEFDGRNKDKKWSLLYKTSHHTYLEMLVFV